MFLTSVVKMGDHRDSGFKSYIDETGLESIALNDDQRTKLLGGENIIFEIPNVLKCAPLTDRKKTSKGVLTITTFKLSFASADEDPDCDGCCQRNRFLGRDELCLSSIDTIYQTGDRTKKKLTPGQTVSGKVKELLIICKNMRTFEFSFKQADKDSGKSIANALLHHAYPKKHSLLFAYEFKEPYYPHKILKEAKLFRKQEDWKKEYERSKCQNWKISLANENFQTSQKVSDIWLVPQSVTDSSLVQAVEHFRNRYCPVWVWGTPKGAALVRMADLLPTITDRTQENVLLEHIRKSHPERKEPCIIDLTKDCPSPKDVLASYLKLRELCVPENTRVFKSQDFKFYGLLDNTKWLSHVSTCLAKAKKAAEELYDNCTTVVLQEGDGVDMNCVISSLTQILIDPFSRTKFGFQTLIQKCWVSTGHPFAYRLGHMLNKDVEPSPIFLLFLDCVWQLQQQFPGAFQISETYLITLWDSTHISIFDTFLFNCEHDRVIAETESSNGHEKLKLRSVWDWSEQFEERDIALFCNPLFEDECTEILRPNPNASSLEIWVQCYFRWLPDLEIQNGGKPQVDLCIRLICSEIHQLQEKKRNGEISGRHIKNKEEYLDLLQKINSFFPFSHNTNAANLVPINTILLSSDALDTQSILNLNNE